MQPHHWRRIAWASSALVVIASLSWCALTVRAAEPLAVPSPAQLASPDQLSNPLQPASPVQPARFALLVPEPSRLPPLTESGPHAPLTLADVEAWVAADHPAIRRADGNVQAARGAWIQAGLAPNPEIGYSGDEMGDAGTAGKQGGFVSQEFVTAGKLRLGRSVESRNVAATEQQREQARLQLLTTVRVAYFEAAAAQRELLLARQLAAMGSQAVRAARLLFEAQEGAQVAVLQSQVEHESAILLVEQAANRSDVAWRQLASAAGRPHEPPRRLDNGLNEPLRILDWETERERLLSSSPELAELRYAIDRARRAVRLASAGRMPNVNVQAGVEFDNTTHETLTGVQVSMPLPLVDRNQGNVTRACGELTAAQAALEERELALVRRLAGALGDYQTASRRAQRFAETILPAAQQSLDLVSRAYEQGELDYLQLLAAQRTYTEKNLAHLQDLETAWKKWAEIEGLMVGSHQENSD